MEKGYYEKIRISLSPECFDKLCIIAEDNGTSKSDIIEKSLNDYFKKSGYFNIADFGVDF
jgi:predicted transcriptional regulator